MSETVSERLCRYPGCDLPAEPGEPGVGRPPEYCANTDHNRAAAWRARQRRTQAGESLADQARPVDAARQRAGLITAQVTGMAEHLVSQLHDLLGELRTVTDPEAAEAEIEAVATDAAEQVAAANARAVRAEQGLRKAISDTEEADAAATEAGARAQDLEISLAQARDEVAQARQEAAELNAVASALTDDLAAIRAERQTLEDENRRLVDELAQTREEVRTAHQVTKSAEEERDAAELRAAADRQYAQDEANRAVAADQSALEARDRLEHLRAQFDELREHSAQIREASATLAAERDAARSDVDRERQHGDQRVQDLHDTYSRQLADLRALIPAANTPTRRSRANMSDQTDQRPD